MKATVSSKITALDSGQGFIFMAAPDDTTFNVKCVADHHYERNFSRMKKNINTGDRIALVGVWKRDQFNIELFCDPQSWEAY